MALDSFGIPTGGEAAEKAEAAPLGRRTFDDLYALGRTAGSPSRATTARPSNCGANPPIPYAQVWVPAGRTYAALEPMAAPTNALGAGSAPLVEPGDSYSARFVLALT